MKDVTYSLLKGLEPLDRYTTSLSQAVPTAVYDFWEIPTNWDPLFWVLQNISNTDE